MEKKKFIVRIIKKEKWDNGYINMDLSWDVPFDQFSIVMDYLSKYEMRAKRKKKLTTN